VRFFSPVDTVEIIRWRWAGRAPFFAEPRLEYRCPLPNAPLPCLLYQIVRHSFPTQTSVSSPSKDVATGLKDLEANGTTGKLAKELAKKAAMGAAWGAGETVGELVGESLIALFAFL
jgi:hypothetical protein